MNIQQPHTCFFHAHSINLLPGRSRHVFKFALMAAKELYRQSLVSPIILMQGLHYPNNCSGNQNWCGALLRVNGSVAYCFCTTTKVKMLCFATSIFSVSCTFRVWSFSTHLICPNPRHIYSIVACDNVPLHV